ncbi:hypothetical protein C4565_00510 [Candidatus Parcubacteria bacterium]|nr:MAG: hypothetical protein C4565_00510 [Candidatus Parcubacteria bacterium]
MNRTPEELNKLIDKETELIKTLEKTYPVMEDPSNRYSHKNLPWEIHHTKVRDAYWRRRMLLTELGGGDLNKTAEVY